ncbi:hypothetical protein PCURB6_35770 [Paenibacillus curdlanolyticus]|nr:hypothetical protein PCURB6_35770 [Paenibacillus curdlanolyticus]
MNCGLVHGACSGYCSYYNSDGQWVNTAAYVGYVYCSDGSTKSISHCGC